MSNAAGGQVSGDVTSGDVKSGESVVWGSNVRLPSTPNVTTTGCTIVGVAVV